jgi:hypothetical protein
MKTIIATAAILAALSAPSFAETAGTDALGSDHGSFRLSQKDPSTASGQLSMAQHVKMSTHSYGTSRRRG